MKLRQIIGELETFYNSKLAEDWDNVGLMLGNEDMEINKILVCLDITNNAVEKAISENVDLIISHHPFIFSGLKKINDETPLGNKALKLMKNNIAVYSIHTNADFALNGLNDYVLDKFKLQGRVKIKNMVEFQDYNHRKQQVENVIGGTVRIKILNEEMELLDLIRVIKENLGLSFVRYVGENKKVSRIGIVTGGGSSFVYDVKNEIDVFLTGDLRHHESLDMLEEGKILVDIGHYESEYLFADLLERDLGKFFDGIVIKYFDEQVFKLG